MISFGKEVHTQLCDYETTFRFALVHTQQQKQQKLKPEFYTQQKRRNATVLARFSEIYFKAIFRYTSSQPAFSIFDA
jgi:hypothetical protein